MNRQNILDMASSAVHAQDVDHDYGTPEDNFRAIAALWDQYLISIKYDYTDNSLMPRDVAAMMVLLKIARVAVSEKADNWVDIAGYAACGGEIDGPELS